MTEHELNTLKIIQMNIKGDLEPLTRDVLIFKLASARALIDRLIAIEETRRKDGD